MTPIYNQLLIPFITAMALAITMGGSGTAPAFSAAYGANVIRKSIIPGLFGIVVFVGAFLAGKKTAGTMGSGILPSGVYDLYGRIDCLVFYSCYNADFQYIRHTAVYQQAAVLALAAPAVYFGKLDTQVLFAEIIPAWFILPVISYFLSYFCGKYIYQPMRRRGLTIQRAQNENRKHIWDIVLVVMAVYVSLR